MKIFERIDADIKAAMLAEKRKSWKHCGQKNRFYSLQEARRRCRTLTDETELKVIRKLISQREEAAEIYKKEGREDLYQKEINEAKFISAYLPP
jgi:uncharacterized protein YqeY